ncbi:hypothetical protein BDC45DRAFT_495288 [Circinella umbellata]|nr:hypothetical protein BDC45DRAFT_495288 [Circinella umbellata]
MFSTLSLVDDEGYGPTCSGCNNDIEEGSVIAFGDALFHLNCFTCAKCHRPADCESNLLLLSDGRPVCESCSYNCFVCKQVIRDEAIMTGDEAYHANCFRCASCKRKIEDLVFTQTNKGIYCTPCHEKRKLERQKRKEEKERKKKQYNLAYATKSLPSIPSGFQQSPTSPTTNNNLGSPPPIPTRRPGALNERPYMSNRHASRLFDADMVTGYMETENKGPPTPARSRSSSVDNISNQKRNSTLLQQHYLQLSPSRSTGLSSSSNNNAGENNKRLSVIPDEPSLSQQQPSLPPSPPQRPPRPSINNSSNLLLSSSTSTTASSSTKTLDMALPDIPSLNFSYFDNDSAELLNLTKDLGVFDAKTAAFFGNNEKIKQEAAKIMEENNNSTKRITQASRVLSASLMDAFPEPPLPDNQQLQQEGVDELPDNVAQLKSQLQLCKRKLADTETNFQKIKDASKRALDEFQNAKEEFAKEINIRQQHEKTIQQLQQQITLVLHAQKNDPESFIIKAKNDIERLANVRVELERTCEELKRYRSILGTPDDDQQAGLGMIRTEMSSLRTEREALAFETRELSKLRDDVINEMIMLNTKNAELTNMNNDLSRRVTEREREAAAVMAGTSFIRRGSEEQSTAKVVARDSFNGTQAPKVFKIKPKNFFKKSNSTDAWSSPSSSSSTVTSGSGGPGGMIASSPSTLSLANHNPNGTKRHAFHPVSFIRPTRCDVCNDKVWGRSDLRCQGCGFITHAKCLSHAPQACIEQQTEQRSNSLDDHLSNTTSLFGLDLTEQVTKEARSVPRVVEQCIDAVEARGMDYEGIYRKSGGAAQMRTIQLAFERDLPLDLDDDEEFNDICAVTSVLKHYFRKLPNPLLTFELYSKWIEVGTMDPASKHNAVIAILEQLPKANYDTLKVLICHLHRVHEQSSENLMTTRNLAVVFAPTLMRDHDATRDLLDMSYKKATLEYLINQAMQLFP